MTEANGLNADFFITQYPHDPRRCMYTANAAIMRDIGRFSDQFSDTIVASENLVRTWYTTGVPLDDSIIGWDIPSDPTVAARFLGRNVTGRQTPPQLPVVEFCLAHRAFLRMDMPVSEMYRVCIGEDEVTKRPGSTAHRAMMLQELAMQALRDRNRPAGGREDLQVIYGSLKTMNRILKVRFVYPSPSRGEPSLRWGSRVPRTPDMVETWRNAKNVDARRGFCGLEGCQHGNVPRFEVVTLASSS